MPIIGGGGGGGGTDPWTAVTKLADQTVTSNASYVNDSELFFATASGALYLVHLAIVYASPAGAGTPDIRFGLGEDATVRGYFTSTGVNTSDTLTVAAFPTDQGATNIGLGGTAAAKRLLVLDGAHLANGGTVRFVWAQFTSGVNGTIVYAGSSLRYLRVS